MKESMAIKTLCYILAPILIVTLLISIAGMAYVERYPDTTTTNSFTQTEKFMIKFTYSDVEKRNMNYQEDEAIYNICKAGFEAMPTILPISVIGLVFIITYLIASVGHKRGQEEIYLSSFDKIPLEITLVVLGMLYALAFGALVLSVNIFITYKSQIICACIGAIPTYLVMILTFVTILRRLKSHTLLKNTLLYKVAIEIKLYFENAKATFKIGAIYAAFILASLILVVSAYNEGKRSHYFTTYIMGSMWILPIKPHSRRPKNKNIHPKSIRRKKA